MPSELLPSKPLSLAIPEITLERHTFDTDELVNEVKKVLEILPSDKKVAVFAQANLTKAVNGTFDKSMKIGVATKIGDKWHIGGTLGYLNGNLDAQVVVMGSW